MPNKLSLIRIYMIYIYIYFDNIFTCYFLKTVRHLLLQQTDKIGYFIITIVIISECENIVILLTARSTATFFRIVDFLLELNWI